MQRNKKENAGVSYGFSLIEVLTALAILAFVSSSVLLVVDRCMASAADSALRMEAFVLARENMEKILASESVTETVEYGRSDRYPDVSWQTVVEPFAEPLTGKTWVRAVCSAEYLDSVGEQQIVELEHWIAELTDQQANQLLGEQEEAIEELKAEQLVDSIDEAAQYAGVDVETIEKWLENGLVTTEDGAFIKHNLDVYVRNDGDPTETERGRQVESIKDLALSLRTREGTEGAAPGRRQGSEGRDSLTGLPSEELEQMEVGDVMELLKQRQGQR